LLAQRAVVRVVGWNAEGQQRDTSHAQVHDAAASIDYRSRPDYDAARPLHCLSRLTRGPASGDYIFDYKHTLAFAESKSAPEGHHPGLALGEKSPRAERPRCLVGYDDTAYRRSYHRVYALGGEVLG
jgi:hypothetical protein